MTDAAIVAISVAVGGALTTVLTFLATRRKDTLTIEEARRVALDARIKGLMDAQDSRIASLEKRVSELYAEVVQRDRLVLELSQSNEGLSRRVASLTQENHDLSEQVERLTARLGDVENKKGNER